MLFAGGKYHRLIMSLEEEMRDLLPHWPFFVNFRLTSPISVFEQSTINPDDSVVI